MKQFEEDRIKEEERQRRHAAKIEEMERQAMQQMAQLEMEAMAEIRHGAAMCLQSAYRGNATRAALAASGETAMRAVLEKQAGRPKDAQPSTPTTPTTAKVQRSNSFALKGRRAASRVQRAKNANSATMKKRISDASPTSSAFSSPEPSPGVRREAIDRDSSSAGAAKALVENSPVSLVPSGTSHSQERV